MLLVALVAGGVVGVALLSSSGTDSTGATVGSTVGGGGESDPQAAMVSAVRDYYGVVTGNEAAGWARLGPNLQARTGGFGNYQAFWSTISSVQVVDASALDADTVRATLDFAPEGRERSQEVHELGMVQGPDGRWLIDTDESVDAASPRAAATGLSLEAPVAEASGPTTTSSPPPTQAEDSHGGDDPHGHSGGDDHGGDGGHGHDGDHGGDGHGGDDDSDDS